MDTKKLRQKILDLAIRGKLVPQDPNDEPASVLLERIRAEKEQLIKEGKIKRTKKSNASDTSHYENVQFEVPEGWCWVRVYDISSAIIYGVSESAKSEGKYKLLRITDIQNNKVNWNTVPLTDYPEEKAASYTLRTGDILFARTGATVGKSYLVDNSVPENSIYASYLIRVQVSSIINSNYVKYFFESGFYWNQIADNSVGVGQPNVNGTSLGNLWLPIPPIQEQERIVEKLNSWCTIIDEIKVTQESIRATISDLRSRILEYAISGKLVPQDYLDESAIELLKRINPMFSPADNRHYENLPQNWEECALKDIVEIQNGYAFKSSLYSNDGVRVIRITNVQDGYIMDDSPKYYPLSHMDGLADYMLKGNDLLMSLTGNVGRVAMMPVGLLPAALNQRVCCITPKSSEVCKEFLFYLLRTDSFITSCIESGKGVAQLNVSTEWLKSYRIALPPKDEQQRIVKAIQNIMTKIDKILADL